MTVIYPTQTRNYCIFENEQLEKRKDLDIIKQSLIDPKNEDEVVEDLFILNCMIDDGDTTTEEVAKLYPELSRYNNTNSPNIQTFLAGIYRKTKVPDAFGPLVAMLIRNSITQTKQQENLSYDGFPPIFTFDPNEEIGGAILDYLA